MKLNKNYIELLKNTIQEKNNIINDLYNETRRLESEHAEMLEALKYFVNRVEEGSIRSVKTYTKYKSIIEKIEGRKVHG